MFSHGRGARSLEELQRFGAVARRVHAKIARERAGQHVAHAGVIVGNEDFVEGSGNHKF